MSSLNGSWIEVFRAGDYGDRGRWTAQDLDRLVAAYDTRLQPAPVVIGHPTTDSPAYGWVARLRRAGQSLWAQLEKVDKGFESLLRDGRFRQRSVALYRHFAPAGGPYLRHIGFLGAQPPAVKGLAPVRFFAGVTEPATLVFTESISVHRTDLSVPQPHTFSMEVPMPESNLQKLFDHISGFFTEPSLALAVGDGDADPSADQSASRGENGDGDGNDSVSPGFAGRDFSVPSLPVSGRRAEGNPATTDGAHAPTTDGVRGKPILGSPEEQPIADRLAELEQRFDALTASPVQLSPSQPAAVISSEVSAFVESLRAAGKFPPAFDRLGVSDFLHHLAAQPATAFSSGGDEEPSDSSPVVPSDHTPLAWFQEFLTQLPAVIHFGEMSAPAGDASSAKRPAPIRFVEPRRGVEVDPESVQLAERAESLAAAEDITYAEALTRLRTEERRVHSSA